MWWFPHGLKSNDPRLCGLEDIAAAVDSYVMLMRPYNEGVEVLETGLHVHEIHLFIAVFQFHLSFPD